MAILRVVAIAALGVAHVVGAFRPPFTLKGLREQLEDGDGDGGKSTVSIAQREDLSKLYPEHSIPVPIDHFHNDTRYEPHSNDTFLLRYWFDPTYYRKGGPVIVIQGGETNGANRLPFMHKGILAKLSEATGGLSVVLEHRYYGKSFPGPDLSTENMRFLSTDQALADMAYFAGNAVFEGLDHLDLTAPKTAWIAYGGSYAGALVAFVRKLYPDVYWGAIASSAVTVAIYDYWQYFEAARLFAPQGCVVATQKLTNVVDNILLSKENSRHVQRLKTAFGLGKVTRSDDFANAISAGIGGLQDTNWDPALNGTEFGEYCQNVTSTALLHPNTAPLETEVRELITLGGYGEEVDALTVQMLNYIGYVGATAVKECAKESRSQDWCFSDCDPAEYRADDRSQHWRSWPYQFCTEWGYLSTGSDVPDTQLPLISRVIDLNFTSKVCRMSFNITQPSDVESINKHGGYNFSYPRLAFIDGEKDPWRAATPHAIGLPPRESTISEPFILIKDGVHHWDQNGVFPNETTPDFPPPSVAQAQEAQVVFVKEWMKEWRRSRGNEVEEVWSDL